MRRWVLVAGVVGVVGFAAELALLGVALAHLGPAWTLGLVLVKTVAGYVLARRTGRRAWRRFRAGLDARRPPGREVTDGVVGLGAALLVLLAGFIGAVAGLVVLVPPVRRAVARRVERLVQRRVSGAVAGEMFGPRLVRMRRPAPGSADPAPPGTDGPAPPTAAIEGEILPPR